MYLSIHVACVILRFSYFPIILLIIHTRNCLHVSVYSCSLYYSLFPFRHSLQHTVHLSYSVLFHILSLRVRCERNGENSTFYTPRDDLKGEGAESLPLLTLVSLGRMKVVFFSTDCSFH